MDKSTVADVHSNMGDAAAVGVSEEDQVAGLQFTLGDCLSGIILFLGGSRKFDYRRLAKDIACESRTVETGTRCPAHNIGRSTECLCSADDIPAVQRSIRFMGVRLMRFDLGDP